MSQASINYAKEQTRRSLDTIVVHNIDEEDDIFWTDKFGPSASKSLVPGASKDIGYGKGNAHLPRYKAEKYTEDKIVRTINKLSDEKWAKDSKQYRTRDEKLLHAPLEQIRTDNRDLWEKYFPMIWKGVYEVFGNEDLPEPTQERIVDTGSAMGDVLKHSGLADKPYEPEA